MKNRIPTFINTLCIVFMYALASHSYGANIDVGIANFNISSTSAGGTAFAATDNLNVPDFNSKTYTLTSNVQCVNFTLGSSHTLNLNGFTLTITGNLVVNASNNTTINLGNGGQLLVTGTASMGSQSSITGTGSSNFTVGGSLTMDSFNNTSINLGATGSLKVAGNLNVGSGNTVTVGTLEMNGCPQTIAVNSNISLNTFKQSSTCGTTIGASGSGTITTATYDQNNNPTNIKPATNFNVTGSTINGQKTWSGLGGDNNWTTPANWVGGVAPVVGDGLIFTGSTRITPNNNYATGTSFKSITFASAAGDFTLSGNSIILSGGATAITNNKTSGTEIISLSITYSTAPTITSVTGSTLNLTSTQINGGFSITIASTGTTRISGIVSGTGGLTKSGSGVLTLSGINTYSGTTTVAQGELNLAGLNGTNAINGNLVNNGGLITYTNASADQVSNTSNVTQNNTGSIFNGTARNVMVAMNETFGSLTVNGGLFQSGFSSTVNVTNALTVTGGAGNPKFVINSATTFNANSVVLTGLTGLVETDNNGFSLSGAYPAQTALIVGSGGLSMNGSNLSLRKGNAGSKIVLDGNITTTGTVASNIRLDASAGGSAQVELSSTAVAANRTITVGAGGADLDISVPIQNGAATTGSITKQGTGTLTLSEVNTYTGTTTISTGTLKFGLAGCIPDVSAVTVTSTMDVNGISETIGSLAGAGSVNNVSAGGSPVLTNGGNNTNTTFSGVISNSTGSLALVQSGTGTLILSGTNTYTGGTTINAGSTLQIGAGGTTGSIVGNIVNNGTLIFNRSDAYTFSGIISGSGQVIINGGVITLSGLNTYSGLTTINSASTLKLGSLSALGTNAAGTLVNSGGVLDLNGNNYTTAEALTINGTGISSGGAVINSSATVASYAGLITLGSASSIKASVGNINITNAGTISGATFGLTLGGAANGVLSSIIGTTSGSLTKIDAGIWTISGASTYTGVTTITAGTLKLGASGVIPDASAVTVTGTLDMNNFNEAVGSIEGAGTVDNVAGAGSPTLTVGSLNIETTFSGIIKNTTGVLSLTKIGTATFRLSGNNTFSGITNVTNGLLTAESANALGATTAGTVVANGATLVLFSFAYPSEALTIIGNGNEPKGALRTSTTLANTTVVWPGTITLAGNSQIGVEIATVELRVTGVLSGAFDLTKIAAGTLTLEGLNTYTGITTISVGTIKLGSATALGTVASGTTITSGAVLDLNGINYSNLEALTINGTGISNGGAVINSSATAATYAGLITLGSVSTIKASVGNINITNTGTIIGATFGLTLGGAANGVLSSIIGTTSGTLTKIDAGAWTLSGANTFSGGVSLNVGQLNINNASAIGTGTFTIANGTTIDNTSGASITLSTNNIQTWNGDFTFAGTRNLNLGAGAVAMGASLRTITTTAAVLTVGGTISGTAGLTKAGAGTLEVGGTVGACWTGTTTVNAGTLMLRNCGGDAYQSAAWFVNSGGTLKFNSGDANMIINTAIMTINTGGIWDLNSGVEAIGYLVGGGNITNLGLGGFEIDLPPTGTGSNFSGVISGVGQVKIRGQLGAGKQIFSGLNTYTGPTLIQNGTLSINTIKSVSGGASSLGAPTTALNGTIDIGSSTTTGILEYTGTTQTTDRIINLAGTTGGATIVQSGTGLLKFTSNFTAASTAKILTLQGSTTGTGEISGIIFSGSTNVSLVKSGSGSWTNSGTSSYNNVTVSAGTLSESANTVNVAGNFSNSASFTPSTSTIVMSGTSAQTISAANFYNLTINNTSGGISLTGNIAVSNNLTLTSGILNSGASTIDLGTNGSIFELTPNAYAPVSYVTGIVKATRNTGSTSGTVTFGGLGIDITETTKTNNSTVVVRTTGTAKSFTTAPPSPMTYNGIKRFFDITPVNDVALNGTLVIHYFDHELNGSSEANLKIYKDSTGGWIKKKASVASPSTNSISLSGIKDFSLWTASDEINQPLPITLVRFVAEKAEKGTVRLDWTTVSEINNDYFTVEKSIDGLNWFELVKLVGSGTTDQLNNYTYLDSNAARGVMYYRLKQTDFDNKFEYSQVISIDLENNYDKNSLECSVFPSPTSIDNLNLLLSTTDLGEYSVNITNIQGLTVYSKDFVQLFETDVLNLSNKFENVATGIYHLKVSRNSAPVCSQKFILE